MAGNKWTDEQLIAAVKSSTSISQVLEKLGLKPAGGNYIHVPREIKRLSLDTSHFRGQGSNKGKVLGPRRPIKEYLVVDGPKLSSHHLKRKLINEGVKQRRCENCGLTEWLGLEISLELHHVDGRRGNNTLENLLLLCPNCHAQTETYRGKNKGSY